MAHAVERNFLAGSVKTHHIKNCVTVVKNATCAVGKGNKKLILHFHISFRLKIVIIEIPPICFYFLRRNRFRQYPFAKCKRTLRIFTKKKRV